MMYEKYKSEGLELEEMPKRFIYYNYAVFKFVIKEKFKGEFSSDTINIYTSINSAVCGFDFDIGEIYIVYGKGKTFLGSSIFLGRKYPEGNNLIWTNICTRTNYRTNTEVKRLRKLKNK